MPVRLADALGGEAGVGAHARELIRLHPDEPPVLPAGAWMPADGHAGASAMTIRSALRTSSNRAAARMLQRVGIATAVSHARRLGPGEMPAVPSLSLGSGEVTLFDLTSAYGALAAAGILREPVLIRRVEDAHGQILFRAAERATVALSAETAFLTSTMLADVLDSGTGWRMRRMGFRLPAAGKTGTTNDYHDAWLVGFTPSLVTGVWVGYDRPAPILPGSAYAGDVAAPMWARFMVQATRQDRPAWFESPRNIVTARVCRLSDKRPIAACAGGLAPIAAATSSGSPIITEYFVRGAEPVVDCDLHGRGPQPGARARAIVESPAGAR
jgi:penicillin-binding protein 1A